MEIDVIIPVYRPGEELFGLIDRLKKQTVPVHKIILMNTGKSYFEDLVRGRDFEKEYEGVEIHHVSKQEFDHGGTRREGVSYSDAELFVCLTQDAMPEDEYLIERLTENLKDNIAVVYGRQLPSPESGEAEIVSRRFNYPAESRVKTSEDLKVLGIKTFFCSNVCAAYRRDIYDALGGFVRHTIFNEDMIYAAGAIRAGYGVAYEARARVVHSHDYTNIQQLRRNFDLGVSQAEHPEVFSGISSEAEGKKLVIATCRYLKEQKKWYKIPGFFLQCACKYTGYLLGKNYRKLPRGIVLSITANKEYWNS